MPCKKAKPDPSDEDTFALVCVCNSVEGVEAAAPRSCHATCVVIMKRIPLCSRREPTVWCVPLHARRTGCEDLAALHC